MALGGGRAAAEPRGHAQHSEGGQLALAVSLALSFLLLTLLAAQASA